MMLFQNDPITNLLPYDGIVQYHGIVLKEEISLEYYNTLITSIAWQNDEAIIFGKHFITKRKAAWYGDEGFHYTYSNTTKKALPWTKELTALKILAQTITGCQFNSCLLNLYHSGEEGMGWHSDDEKSLKENAGIASFSFGAERKFCFRHKLTKETYPVILENGSLLVMKGSTQKHWAHALPKTKKVSTPRINLTFRMMAG